MVEGASCGRIVEGVVRTQLPCGGHSADEAGFLAVDQRMRAAVPGPSPALEEAEQVDEPGHVPHVVHDVLEPPPFNDLFFIDPAVRVIGHQAGLV